MRLFFLVVSLGLSLAGPVSADDYAGAISAYRRAHGLSAIKSDRRLSAVALKQAQAMASTGTVSHSAGGSFATRVAALRKSRAAENIGAGFISYSARPTLPAATGKTWAGQPRLWQQRTR